MTTITADDIRVLAKSAAEDAALVRVGDEIRVAGGEASLTEVVYTKAQLIEDYGAELSDVEAEVLAAGLTAELAEAPAGDDAGARQRPDTDVTDAPGVVEPPD